MNSVLLISSLEYADFYCILLNITVFYNNGSLTSWEVTLPKGLAELEKNMSVN